MLSFPFTCLFTVRLCCIRVLHSLCVLPTLAHFIFSIEASGGGGVSSIEREGNGTVTLTLCRRVQVLFQPPSNSPDHDSDRLQIGLGD